MYQYIKIAEFAILNDAYMVKSKLIAEGFDVQLENEHTASMYALGGDFSAVNISVIPDQKDEAVDWFVENGYGNNLISKIESPWVERINRWFSRKKKKK